jgi:hypothetical protein
MDDEVVSPPIDVKEAVKSATAFLQQLAPEVEMRNIQLEEVELSDDGSIWFITLGYDRPVPVGQAMRRGSRGVAPFTERVYKIIRVRASDGKALSMKIRFTPSVNGFYD